MCAQVQQSTQHSDHRKQTHMYPSHTRTLPARSLSNIFPTHAHKTTQRVKNRTASALNAQRKNTHTKGTELSLDDALKVVRQKCETGKVHMVVNCDSGLHQCDKRESARLRP